MKKMDNHYAALKLIEALHKKKLINDATFENIKAHYPEGFPSGAPGFMKAANTLFVKDVEN